MISPADDAKRRFVERAERDAIRARYLFGPKEFIDFFARVWFGCKREQLLELLSDPQLQENLQAAQQRRDTLVRRLTRLEAMRQPYTRGHRKWPTWVQRKQQLIRTVSWLVSKQNNVVNRLELATLLRETTISALHA